VRVIGGSNLDIPIWDATQRPSVRVLAALPRDTPGHDNG